MYHFMVFPSKEREVLAFSEDNDQRHVFLEVRTYERLQEIMDAVKDYAENHIFTDEMEFYSINDVVNSH
jgi:hypothetical protein